MRSNWQKIQTWYFWINLIKCKKNITTSSDNVKWGTKDKRFYDQKQKGSQWMFISFSNFDNSKDICWLFWHLLTHPTLKQIFKTDSAPLHPSSLITISGTQKCSNKFRIRICNMNRVYILSQRLVNAYIGLCEKNSEQLWRTRLDFKFVTMPEKKKKMPEPNCHKLISEDISLAHYLIITLGSCFFKCKGMWWPVLQNEEAATTYTDF